MSTGIQRVKRTNVTCGRLVDSHGLDVGSRAKFTHRARAIPTNSAAVRISFTFPMKILTTRKFSQNNIFLSIVKNCEKTWSNYRSFWRKQRLETLADLDIRCVRYTHLGSCGDSPRCGMLGSVVKQRLYPLCVDSKSRFNGWMKS